MWRLWLIFDPRRTLVALAIFLFVLALLRLLLNQRLLRPADLNPSPNEVRDVYALTNLPGQGLNVQFSRHRGGPTKLSALWV
jgi:Antenna complex alpha/beta subunit